MANEEFQCSECGAKFPNEASLERHQRMAHSQPQHICEECGLIFNSEDELQAHVRAAHPEKQINPTRAA